MCATLGFLLRGSLSLRTPRKEAALYTTRALLWEAARQTPLDPRDPVYASADAAWRPFSCPGRFTAGGYSQGARIL